LFDFLRRLTRIATKKVLLILDNVRVHRAGSVKAWLTWRTAAIEGCYLTGCSPGRFATSSGTDLSVCRLIHVR